MIRKVIAIVICLLVILGTVSCAADKKEPPAEEAEEEEELPPSEESPPFEVLYAEDFNQMADSFVHALLLPNMSLLLGSFHPDLLAYMTRVDGISAEDLDAAAEAANATITRAWEEQANGASYSDLTYEYAARQVDAAQWGELPELYAQVPLTVEDAAILDITILYEDEPIGSAALSLVRIDGVWWADPVLTAVKSEIS